MRYKEETLNSYTARALEAIATASRLEQIHIHIAKGNRKVGRVRNVSLMSRICCGNCKTCEHYCYDIKAALQYKTVMTARAENTALAYRDYGEYFRQIAEKMTPKCKIKAFRFHVGGEILDEEYDIRMERKAIGRKVENLAQDDLNICKELNGGGFWYEKPKNK